MIELEKIAHEAASQHSRCSNCNGICPDTATNCDKSRMYVCPTYWDGYYTALDAMERLMKVLEIPITEVEKENRFGLKESYHFLGKMHELSKETVDKAFPLDDEIGLVDFSKFPIIKPIPSNHGEGERDFGLGMFEHWQRDLGEFENAI